jgi:hypothetical protein
MPPQIEKAIASPAVVLMWAAVLFATSLFLGRPGWHGLFEMVPDETVLRRVDGTLTSFRQYTNEEGLRFRLSGSDDFFVLSPYSGAEPAVRRAPPGARFTVFYDPRQPKAPAWSKRQSYVVFVVHVDGSVVRSYGQVSAGAARDFALLPWLAGGAALAGAGLMLWALWLGLRHLRFPRKPRASAG